MGDAVAGVCVVGAGLSGIAAARELSRRGIPFECLERCPPGTAPAARLDVSRERLGFAEWPLPASYPGLPSRRHLARYLSGYAERFGLSPHLRHGVEVRGATPCADGGWELELEPGGRRRCAALLVAGGARRTPGPLSTPGEFAGEQALAAERPALRDRDVIVAGAGREACEVAVAASYVARSTRLSIRRAPHLLPQIALGRPLDRAPGLEYLLGRGVGRGRLSVRVPGPLRRRLLELALRALSSPSLHGLPASAGPPAEVGAVPAADLLERLLHGRIEPRPAIVRLAGDRVLFADGGSAEADLIVWCGGSVRRVPFLPESLQPWRGGKPDLVLGVLPAATPSLAFLGLVEAVAGSPARIAEAQAELAVARLSGRYAPPPRAEPAAAQVEQFEYVRRVERELRAGRRRARRR